MSVVALGSEQGDRFLVPSLVGREVSSVTLPGDGEESWSQWADGLAIERADRPDELGVAIRRSPQARFSLRASSR